MTLTTETLYGLGRAAQAALIDPFPSGQAPEIQLPAAWVAALVAEVRRYRGLADDDIAVERAAKAVSRYGGVDWGGNAHSASSQKVYRGIARAALRAALGQEDQA